MSVEAALKLDPKTDLFWNDFAANAADLPGAGLGWLGARRAASFEAFAASGMPTRRMEAWKYTDLAGALESELEPATPFRLTPVETGALADPFAGVRTARIVLVDGYLHYIGGTALAEEIDVVDLSQLSARTPRWVEDHLGKMAAGADQALGAASLALMRGGVAIRVRAGAAPATPLQLHLINPGRGRAVMTQTRVLMVLEDGASLTLLESHVGEAGEQRLVNLGVELVLGAGAGLTHIRLQAEATSTLHVASLGASLEKDARYRALYAHLGAKLSRLDMNLRLNGPGAEADLKSASALAGETLADVTTVMDHALPHTKSRQLFKSVLGGRARSVAQGRVTVREGAVKSDSHQLFKALLMGPRAEADAKPELEIYADDVACGHGTAIGALDAEALFYLRARGIPENEARWLLVRAFLEDAIEGFADEAVHDALWRGIEATLAGMAGGAA